MSEHEQLLSILREIRDGVRALVSAAGATTLNANPEELLSLVEVDRLLGKANGFASKSLAGGEARAWLDRLPPLEQLMPAIDVDALALTQPSAKKVTAWDG